jgi:hypothetical protein
MYEADAKHGIFRYLGAPKWAMQFLSYLIGDILFPFVFKTSYSDLISRPLLCSDVGFKPYIEAVSATLQATAPFSGLQWLVSEIDSCVFIVKSCDILMQASGSGPTGGYKALHLPYTPLVTTFMLRRYVAEKDDLLSDRCVLA